MIKEINKNIDNLKIVARPATIDDIYILNDLKDTLLANRDRCVGMAANMIGEPVAIIVFFDKNEELIAMLNPRIISSSGLYEAEEGCLSLSGTRKAIRHKKIKVEYQNEKLQVRTKTFNDFEAEIIEHEIDHLKGIII